jgi:hypothetical protein
METPTKENEDKLGKTFLYLMSTQYEGNVVGKTLKWRNEWRKSRTASPSWPLPSYEVTMAFKSLWEVKPGEQDIVFAGGRQDDEELVLGMRGSGQIVIRYSQLGYGKPYSGRSVEELGYSFMIEKGRGDLRALIYSAKFLEGLATRDPQKMLSDLAYRGVFPTGYLEECCKIPISPTPKNLIAEAIAKEEKAISDSQCQYYPSSGRSGGGILDFIKSRY